MARNVVVDTGPIVAALVAGDAFHSWAKQQLADACLVRLTELIDDAAIMTLDADFRVYRRHRRLVIPLLAPEGV